MAQVTLHEWDLPISSVTATVHRESHAGGIGYFWALEEAAASGIGAGRSGAGAGRRGAIVVSMGALEAPLRSVLASILLVICQSLRGTGTRYRRSQLATT